ncbi:zinc ribbon domain-containing protein [Bacillus thuringiensis]|uniref:zinc ribbon domain-containing protein n=1 Tax=Bacillus thuringiensis TaxID=1428 RepID=UPI003D7C21D4|nr:transposase [Bacillus thuringiensis]
MEKQAIVVLKTLTSSPNYSHCGNKIKDVKDLNLREWNCPSCGMYYDRDMNTGKKFKKGVLRFLTVGTTEISLYRTEGYFGPPLQATY